MKVKFEMKHVPSFCFICIMVHCHFYFLSSNIYRFYDSDMQWPTVHCNTVLYFPLFLSGFHTVGKLSIWMLRERRKAIYFSLILHFHCFIILFGLISVFKIIWINQSEKLEKATFYIAGRVMCIMFNWSSSPWFIVLTF